MNFSKDKSNNLIISSEMMIWDGPDIPCIDLCKGDTITKVVYNIGKLLCDLYTEIDSLTDLSYSCVIQDLIKINDLKDPQKFSLKLLFQFLLDNDCKLQELIKNIPTTSTSTSVNLSGLNLQCVTQEIVNLCGQVPDVLDPLKVLQAIINILCGIQDDVASLLIRIINLEIKINSLGNPLASTYTEPLITSCLSSTPTQLSLHVTNVTDPAICDLNTLVGTQAQLNTLINNMCLDDYQNTSGIIKNPTSIAQTGINKSIIICDLLERIKNIENTCCSLNCNDIEIGFSQTYDAALNEYMIVFSAGAGTNIPLGFTDCGSEFVITDWKGVQKIISNSVGTLINGSVFTIPLSGSGLDYSKPMNLQIKTCFSNSLTGLICKDCFGGSLDAASLLSTTTCWDFAVPDTDVLACPGKLLNYDTLYTTQGVYISGGGNTSVSGNLVAPSFPSTSSVSNIQVCTNKIILTLKNQSTIDPPRLNLAIQGLSNPLSVSIVGTLNSTCTC